MAGLSSKDDSSSAQLSLQELLEASIKPMSMQSENLLESDRAGYQGRNGQDTSGFV